MNTQEIQEAIARVSDAYGRAVAAEVRARERVVAAGEMVWELTQESGPARFRALVLALSERGLTLKAVEKALDKPGDARLQVASWLNVALATDGEALQLARQAHAQASRDLTQAEETRRKLHDRLRRLQFGEFGPEDLRDEVGKDPE